MANNRLYLVDTETKRALLLAKSWGDGWQAWYGSDGLDYRRLSRFLDDALDFEAQSGMPNTNPHSNLVIMTEDELPDDIAA